MAMGYGDDLYGLANQIYQNMTAPRGATGMDESLPQPPAQAAQDYGMLRGQARKRPQVMYACPQTVVGRG